jgi:integrase
VDAIDEAMVLSVLKPIWHDKTVSAQRLRNRIEKVLDYATAAKFRTGDNPARWSILKHFLARPEKIARVKHFAALPYAEMPAFMARLRAMDRVDARALEFTILTAARTGEVIGARADEFDLNSAVWNVPAERMKTRKEHRVPLSPRAVALLRALYTEDGNAHVFVGRRAGKPLYHLAMHRVLRELHPAATTHGFRSSFSDWANETTSYPNHVIEQALAHAVGSTVERAYRRGDLFDKRRKLMQAWAAYCSAPAAAGAVILIKRRS